MITKTHKIIGSAVVIIALFAIYIFFDRQSRNTDNLPDIYATKATTTTTTTDKNNTDLVNIEGTGNYKIEQVGGGGGIPQPVPDLNRKVTIYAGAMISPEASNLATEKILALQAQLKKDSTDFKAWINLGIYQKMAGDYQGAIFSWQYAGRLAPTNYISLGNLGNLYAYFLKDNGQAEVYYQQAISKAPNQAYLYVQLAEIYRDIFKDLDKARAIVNQGLSKIPNDQNLLQLQASLSSSGY